MVPRSGLRTTRTEASGIMRLIVIAANSPALPAPRTTKLLICEGFACIGVDLLGVPAPLRMLDICQRLLYVHSIDCLRLKFAPPLVDDLPFDLVRTMTIAIGDSISHQEHQEPFDAEQRAVIAKEVSRVSSWPIFLVKVE